MSDLESDGHMGRPRRPAGQSATRRESEAQQAEAERLLNVLWTRVDELVALRDSDYFDVEATSTLHVDDLVVYPLKASTVTHMAISSAIDHLHAVAMIIRAGDMPMSSAFTLLRSALETAAVAIWLLESDDRSVRIGRTLHEAWADIRDAEGMQTDLGAQLDPPRDAREDLVRRAHLGWPDAGTESELRRAVTITSKISVAVPVVARLSGSDRPPMSIRGLWRGFSGITHGRGYAMQTILDREEVGYDEQSGVVTVIFTTGARSLLGSTLVVLDVVNSAVKLYGSRSVAWSNLPADVEVYGRRQRDGQAIN